MSFVTKCIGVAKKLKHRYSEQIKAHTPVYLSPVRRIERVATTERICAMTFDDGPCRLPANPDHFNGKPLTLVLAETLEQYGAKGTFDVVGDTSGNYPDTPGKEGTAAWGGIAYDHYPDFDKDLEGGVAHCPELVERLLEGGHQITSHTWKHILWGRKNIVYASRHHMNSLTEVVEDLKEMDRTMQEKWNYFIRLSRPPHYVDRIAGGYDAYDAYALMDYQYLAASFDGAGWLPLATYEAEVEATWKPLERLLAEDPDALCGQIIFQKDGYNMARRSPVADGLAKQLEILERYGYRVVTVDELLNASPFADTADENATALLEQGWCVAYRDNTLRKDAVLTKGELAMMVYGREGIQKRVELIAKRKAPCKGMKPTHPYAGAAALAVERLGWTAGGWEAPATRAEVRQALNDRSGTSPEVLPEEPMTHETFFALAAEARVTV